MRDMFLCGSTVSQKLTLFGLVTTLWLGLDIWFPVPQLLLDTESSGFVKATVCSSRHEMFRLCKSDSHKLLPPSTPRFLHVQCLHTEDPFRAFVSETTCAVWLLMLPRALSVRSRSIIWMAMATSRTTELEFFCVRLHGYRGTTSRKKNLTLFPQQDVGRTVYWNCAKGTHSQCRIFTSKITDWFLRDPRMVPPRERPPKFYVGNGVWQVWWSASVLNWETLPKLHFALPSTKSEKNGTWSCWQDLRLMIRGLIAGIKTLSLAFLLLFAPWNHTLGSDWIG